jgi:membrane associated rhomboid family serine protease
MANDDDEKRDPDAWIEKVVKAGSYVGMNPTRLRWKLMRWQENRRRAKRRLEQKVDHVTYAHKTCPECGSVQDRDAETCSKCEAKLGRRGFQMLGRLGIASPKAISTSTLLAIAMLAVYAREVVAMGGGLAAPSSQVLYELGAHQIDLDASEPWRLLTACFLHIGFWHIAFNVIALASIGQRIEELYGRATTLFLFVATGVLANFLTDVVNPHAASAGASGAIMGLVGVAGAYGHRMGNSAGRALRADMIKWALYTLIFGYAVGADNWAHLFGALTGAAFGLAVPARWWMQRKLAAVRAIAGVIGAGLFVAALALIFTREVRPPRPEMDETISIGEFIVPCKMVFAGHNAAAAHQARLLNPYAPVELTPDVTAQVCRELLEEADACAAMPYEKMDIEARRSMKSRCDEIGRLRRAFPERGK